MVETSPSDKVLSSMERFARECKDKRVIYLSNDGIFDGDKGQYIETDTPRPKTLYGYNLALCEQVVAQFCANFCIIRPSYIYGRSKGKLDNRLAKTCAVLESGREVKLFSDMYKSPLGVDQVAQAVVDLARLGYVGIVHVAGERMSVYDFHYQAMVALKIDPSNLKGCTMPSDGGFLRDTSLDCSLWLALTQTLPKGIGETLAN
jgi:dTDP-4-dehydrorhamnose reductase